MTASGGPTVGDVCTTRFLTAPRRRRVTEVARFMGGHWVSCAIVTDAGLPVGIVTKQSLVEDVLARGYTGLEITCGDIMRRPLVTLDAAVGLDDAVRLMARTSIRHLAVTRDGRLIGVLSDYHVARLLPRLMVEAAAGNPAAGDAAAGDVTG